MMNKYQRAHLRAPCFTTILFSDEGYVFKAETLNISEGGMLLKGLPHFPAAEKVRMMLSLPQYPSFINFSLQKLKEFSTEVFPQKIIRLQSHMVRRSGDTTDVDDVFKSKLGIKFDQVERDDQKLIADYVTIFTGNIVYLQTIMEQINSSEEALEKSRALAKILGYDSSQKISVLKKEVLHDYKSLQWL